MNIVLFAGSLREGSYNKMLLKEAARILGKRPEIRIIQVDLKGLNIPVYDADIENGPGIPEGVRALGNLIKDADALVISSPEYNGGISGVLKNTVDWLSRLKPDPQAGKHLLLLAASPGALGGVRALWHSRQPLEVVGMHVFPEMMGLGGADKAFGKDGQLADEKQISRLQKLLDNFMNYLNGRK